MSVSRVMEAGLKILPELQSERRRLPVRTPVSLTVISCAGLSRNGGVGHKEPTFGGKQGGTARITLVPEGREFLFNQAPVKSLTGSRRGTAEILEVECLNPFHLN